MTIQAWVNQSIAMRSVATFRALLLLALAFSLPVCAQVTVQQLDDPGTAVEQAATQRVAPSILQDFDRKEYAASWSRTGSYLRTLVKQSDWARIIATYRGGLGALRERRLDKFGFSDTLDNAPDARYAVLSYQSEFETATVREKVVLAQEDNEWKLAGYFVRRGVAKSTATP